MAYTFPIWLLTVDDVRNNQIADMLEDTFDSYKAQKEAFYDSLEGTLFHHKALYDLLEMQTVATKMLLEIFRCNINVLHTELPEIDVYRLRNISKHALAVWRSESKQIVHQLSDDNLLDSIHHPNKWDEHPKFSENGEPVDWNGIVLSRLSEIHRHIHDLSTHVEGRILLNRQGDADLVRRITDNTLPSLRLIFQELQSYCRLVNSI